jgi:hypothetical protein
MVSGSLTEQGSSRRVWESFWMQLLVSHLQMQENRKLRNFSVFVVFSTIENASIESFGRDMCQMFAQTRVCAVLSFSPSLSLHSERCSMCQGSLPSSSPSHLLSLSSLAESLRSSLLPLLPLSLSLPSLPFLPLLHPSWSYVGHVELLSRKSTASQRHAISSRLPC